VKGRAYGSLGEAGSASAVATLHRALHVLLRLFAPFLPYATEVVWSWWQEGSIHRTPWPVAEAAGRDDTVLVVASDVLGEIRRAKSEAKRSMRAPVTRAVVRGRAEEVAALRQVEADLREAGTVAELELVEAPDLQELSVEVELADPD
jgi:valyl-tRNA synthetase